MCNFSPVRTAFIDKKNRNIQYSAPSSSSGIGMDFCPGRNFKVLALANKSYNWIGFQVSTNNQMSVCCTVWWGSSMRSLVLTLIMFWTHAHVLNSCKPGVSRRLIWHGIDDTRKEKTIEYSIVEQLDRISWIGQRFQRLPTVAPLRTNQNLKYEAMCLFIFLQVPSLGCYFLWSVPHLAALSPQLGKWRDSATCCLCTIL